MKCLSETDKLIVQKFGFSLLNEMGTVGCTKIELNKLLSPPPPALISSKRFGVSFQKFSKKSYPLICFYMRLKILGLLLKMYKTRRHIMFEAPLWADILPTTHKFLRQGSRVGVDGARKRFWSMDILSRMHIGSNMVPQLVPRMKLLLLGEIQTNFKCQVAQMLAVSRMLLASSC